MEPKRGRKAKKRRFHWGILSLMTVVLMTAVALAGIAVWGLPTAVQARIDILPDRRAVDGRLHGKEGAALEDGQYRVVVNQLPTMKEGSRECNIEFENPPENQYGARINLYETSDGTLIGGTRRVDPGKYVETIELNRTLEAGVYPVWARIELFDGTEPSGELKLEITLRVIKK